MARTVSGLSAPFAGFASGGAAASSSSSSLSAPAAPPGLLPRLPGELGGGEVARNRIIFCNGWFRSQPLPRSRPCSASNSGDPFCLHKIVLESHRFSLRNTTPAGQRW